MLSNKYPQVVFLEVDVHVCQVSTMLYFQYTWIFIQKSKQSRSTILSTDFEQQVKLIE